jgi:hypothetical protein
MIKIYKLIHNGQIVYVGQTKQRLNRRKASGYAKNEQLHKITKECKMELIEETDDVSRERYWIELLKSEGHPLLNILKGSGLDKAEYDKEYQKRENRKDSRKRWRENNKEKIKEYNKQRKKNIIIYG